MGSNRRQPFGALLGPLEADVMGVVWDRGDVTVRDVHEVLGEDRRLAYTTVMTTMGRLVDKRLLARAESERAHRYSALVSREQYGRKVTKSVLDWLVGQFRDPAVAYFVDRLEEEDMRLVESLRRVIEQRAEADG
ncbi:MAG: BlaI/MecI/CopY family transcriptional regulator [Actinomycetota bacterium]